MDQASQPDPQPEISFARLVMENQHARQRAVGAASQRQPQQDAFGGAPAVRLGLEFVDAEGSEGDERQREVEVE